MKMWRGRIEEHGLGNLDRPFLQERLFVGLNMMIASG